MNMHSMVMQFAAGRTFFVGMALVVAACAVRFKMGRRGLGAPLTVAAVAGGLLVLLSGTPLPWPAYGLWFLALGVCVTTSELPKAQRGKLHASALAALVLLSAGMVVAEYPHHLSQPLAFPRDRPVFVIGDSLALALETGVEPWPSQFAAQSGLQVISLAAGGKRTGGTTENAERVAATDASLLIEIGGNDMLAAVSGLEFEGALARLLEVVCTPGRTVAMFELPVVPLMNSYGRVQRAYARKYHVVLIPKGCMASILADPRATVDGLHLSGIGHAKMAALVAHLVEAGCAPARPDR